MLQAGGGVASANRLSDPPFGEIGSCARGDPGASANLRKGIADNDDFLRPKRLNAGQGDLDIGIALYRPFDEAIEFPVMEGVPPANWFGLRHGLLCNHGFPSGPVGNGHLDLREIIVRPDRTAAKHGHAEGDRESAFRQHRICPSALAASKPKDLCSPNVVPRYAIRRDFTVLLYCDFTAALGLIVDSERNTIAFGQTDSIC